MRFLPGKRSRGWIWICLLHGAILFAAILISRAALKLPVMVPATASLVILAFSLAVIAGAGGWMGGRLFYLCSAIGTLIGAGYLLYLSITDAAPGWGDLAGIISFIFLSAIGIGAGLIAELIRFLVLKKLKNNQKF